MRYPPQFLDRLRQHFRLSEVIGRSLTLRKAGREFHALCPFHNEKTPSFTINDEKAFYHCFGCGAHGDVINFVKEHEGLSWNQAIEKLANEAGIEVPRISQEMRVKLEQNETLYSVLEKACAWFTQKLRQTSGENAKLYLQGRGVSEETAAAFRLGFAPDGREALKSAMLTQGISLRHLEETGLLSKTDTGASYDKFRGRLMFPIRDISGRVVGLGGRLLVSAEHAPKYLNSPQTILFDKGRLLYNADQARVHIARGKPLLVAEGYMDVIALSQADFRGAVAPLGTAVTEDHLRLLWQLADEPILCLDGDKAGLRAMNRVAMLALPLLKPGKSLRFCLLPSGEDPDSLIKARGAKAMQAAIDAALPLVEMLWRLEVLEQPNGTPEQRAGTEQRLLRAVENIQDAGVKRAYKEELRQRFWQLGKEGSRKAPSNEHVISLSALKATTAGAHDNEWRKDTCIRQMLSIILRFPKILEKPEVESNFNALMPMHAGLSEFQRQLTEAWMSGELTRERFMAKAEKAETTAWNGAKPQFDLQQLLKQHEDEGAALAHRYYIRLASQLIEIQMESDLMDVAAQTDYDDQACERLHALKIQLHRMKSQDPIVLGDA